MKPVLLVNKTETPFILSDNPVVYSNWFCNRRFPGRTGMGLLSSGLQVLMPLAPDIAILLHDPNVYGIVSLNSALQIKSKITMESINDLQWFNSHSNVYIPPNIPPSETARLLSLEAPKSRSYFHRAEATEVPGEYKVTDKDEFAPLAPGVGSEMIAFGSEPSHHDLIIPGISLRPAPRYYYDGSAASPLRDKVWADIIGDFSHAVDIREISFDQIFGFATQHPSLARIGPWFPRLMRELFPAAN